MIINITINLKIQLYFLNLMVNTTLTAAQYQQCNCKIVNKKYSILCSFHVDNQIQYNNGKFEFRLLGLVLVVVLLNF